MPAAEVGVPTLRERSRRPTEATLARIALSLSASGGTMAARSLYVPQIGTRSPLLAIVEK